MSQVNKQRVAKNSLLLYIRVLISMLITLWTTRIVLRALGVEDYGIYNVVAGFVVMFSIISSSLSAAISRYITYEIGRGDSTKLNQIFRASVYIQLVIAFIVLFIGETLGIWFLNIKLNIPENSITAANWVYQLSIVAFLIDIISVPYNALLIAHERMKVFAYIGILTSVAKFGAAYFLLFFPSGHRLIIYAALLLVISLCVRIYYGYYCAANFEESKGSIKCEKKQFKEIFSFAGWNFIGSTAGIFKEQGVNILLNLFFGPIVNASRAIAVQVSGAATTFANNFMVALNPQITKSYAAGEETDSVNLVFLGSRMGFYLMFIISLPILLETKYILNLWLNEVPEYSIVFVRLILVNSLIEVLSSTLMTIMLATGRIRNYQLIVGGCNLMVLPFAYVILKLGFEPQYTIIVSIIMALVALFCRLIVLRQMVTLSIKKFLVSVIFRITLVALTSYIISYGIFIIADSLSELSHFIVICMCCITITLISILTLGITTHERNMAMSYIRNITHKLTKK